MKCEVHGCENEAEFYDNMDNKICVDCMEQSIEDEGFEYEDFENIETGSVIEHEPRIRKVSELNETEIMLRALIYAVESKDIPHSKQNEVDVNLSGAFLQHKLNQAKQFAKENRIPLVKMEN